MITGDELIVIAKMANGEQVMACLIDEDERYVEFQYPILIRMIPVSETKETIAATPYCQFSADTKFLIDKRNVMFIKKLHPTFIPHFMRFAAEYANVEFVARERKHDVSEIFEGEDELTIEEIQRRIAMLEAIAGGESDEIEELEKNFVDGNDTVH